MEVAEEQPVSAENKAAMELMKAGMARNPGEEVDVLMEEGDETTMIYKAGYEEPQ